MNKKVYLEGTQNGSDWHEGVISKLAIDHYFADQTNTSLTQVDFDYQQSESDFLLYVITPSIDDFGTISSLIDNSNKYPEKTIFCFISKESEKKFNIHQVKSLNAIGKMVEKNGGKFFESIEDTISFLNNG